MREETFFSSNLVCLLFDTNRIYSDIQKLILPFSFELFLENHTFLNFSTWAVSFCNSFPAAASVLEPPKEGYVEGGYLHNASLGWIQLPTSTGCLQTLLRGQVMRRESLWVDAFRCKIGWFWGRLGPSSLAQACYLNIPERMTPWWQPLIFDPKSFVRDHFFDRRIKSFLILGILNSKLPDNSVPTNKNRKGDIFFNKNPIACCVVHLFLWISKIPKIQWSPAVPRIPNQIILRGTTCGKAWWWLIKIWGCGQLGCNNFSSQKGA